MKCQISLLDAAIGGLLALGVTAIPAKAVEQEKCFGVAKAGQNACNSNKSKHSCAGHSKIDNDPNDFVLLPSGSCLKIGGKLEPSEDKSSPAG
jgi:uncharacterized membrane protein